MRVIKVPRRAEIAKSDVQLTVQCTMCTEKCADLVRKIPDLNVHFLSVGLQREAEPGVWSVILVLGHITKTVQTVNVFKQSFYYKPYINYIRGSFNFALWRKGIWSGVVQSVLFRTRAARDRLFAVSQSVQSLRNKQAPLTCRQNR